MSYYLLALLVVVTDQLLKVIIALKLEPFQSVWVFKNVLSITYVRNYGAAFGILQSQTLLLITLTLVVILFVWVNRNKLSGYPKVFQLGLALALGGAFGNLVDRVRLGYVIDFLDLQLWPVFNFADIAIVGGVGLIIIGLYFDKSQLLKKLSDGPSDGSCGTADKEDF